MTSPVDRYDDLLTQLAGCARSMLQQIEDARREQAESFGRVRDLKAGDVAMLPCGHEHRIVVAVPSRRWSTGAPCVTAQVDPKCGSRSGWQDLAPNDPIRWVSKAPAARGDAA